MTEQTSQRAVDTPSNTLNKGNPEDPFNDPLLCGWKKEMQSSENLQDQDNYSQFALQMPDVVPER